MPRAGHLHPLPSDESGFTVVEVLVAGALLVLGMLATFSVLDSNAKATAVNRQRDVGNAIAQELVERAVGGRYTATNNDMTDVTVGAAQPGPADRLRAALDPDGDQSSTSVSPATVVSGATPLIDTPQSWTLRRRGTTYTVSYRSCTNSDVFGGLTIAGPFDCGRSTTTTPTSPNTGTSGSCLVGIGQNAVTGNTAAGNLGVNLQLLGLSGLNACIALPTELSQAICNLAGTSTVLNGVLGTLVGDSGIANVLLGSLASQAGVSICPAAQVNTMLQKAYAGVGSSTKFTATVSWTDLAGKTQTITRSSTVRRPT